MKTKKTTKVVTLRVILHVAHHVKLLVAHHVVKNTLGYKVKGGN